MAVEAAYGRPVMVGFHALFSFGGMIGSLMGSVAAGHAIEPQWHLARIGGALAAASIPVCRHMLVDASQPLPDTTSTRKLLRPLIGLGAVAFCILLGEGAMADWSAVLGVALLVGDVPTTRDCGNHIGFSTGIQGLVELAGRVVVKSFHVQYPHRSGPGYAGRGFPGRRSRHCALAEDRASWPERLRA